MATTELGSPIGTGVADWDLEAFWRARAADEGQEATDARASGDVGLENAHPGDDEEMFWDAVSEFSELEEEREHKQGEEICEDAGENEDALGDASEPRPVVDGEELPPTLNEGLARRERDGDGGDGVPVNELIGGTGKERDALSPLSQSESEDELDRWMLGSRSQTTEESTPGSAASSTLDSAEWGLFEPLLGAAAAAGEASPNGKEPARQEQGSPLVAGGSMVDPVLAGVSAASAAEKPLPLSVPALCHDSHVIQPGSPLVLGQPGLAAADGIGPVAASRSECLDLIPDSELTCLLRVFEEEEPDMLPLHLQQGRGTTASKERTGGSQSCDEARPSPRAGLASPDMARGSGAELEAVPGSSPSSHSKGRGSTGAGGGWRLLMRRSSPLMQYSSWVRDRGRHFGAMEFRGRMLLLPKPDPSSEPGAPGASGAPGTSGAPGPAEHRWGAAVVRDFLLDEIHRAEWDESREASEVLEEWDQGGCSTARWVRRLPLFLRSREYVVGRRVWSPASWPGVYYCISKSTEHPAAPRVPTAMRVSSFFSSWRVRALSAQETEQERQELATSNRQGGQGKGRNKSSGQEAGGPRGAAEHGRPQEGGGAPAVEIITHYEEESGLPRDLVRVGVAHGMWGHMLKMEHALRNYFAAGRSLRHVLPAFLLEVEQPAAAAEAVPVQREEAGARDGPGCISLAPISPGSPSAILGSAIGPASVDLAGCEPPPAHSACKRAAAEPDLRHALSSGQCVGGS